MRVPSNFRRGPVSFNMTPMIDVMKISIAGRIEMKATETRGMLTTLQWMVLGALVLIHLMVKPMTLQRMMRTHLWTRT